MKETLKSLCFSGRLIEAIRILFTQRTPFDSATYSLLLQESIHRRSFPLGARVHAHSILTGHVISPFLRTKLLIFYSKLSPHSLPPAHHLFDEMSLVSHNALISSSSSSSPEHSLDLYYSLRCCSPLRPDRYTFASVLRACARLAKLDRGRRVHAHLLKTHPPNNLILNTALVDMYSKCSSLADARQAFDLCPDRNVVTWSTLISGYGHHGCPLEALSLFARMQREGFTPNSVTFLAVLSACSHSGLVEAGLEYFRLMKVYSINPKAEHYAAVVDMLGRAGRLKDAYEFVHGSYCGHHSVVWGALLGACRIHREGEMGKIAAERLFGIEPTNVGKYVVLGNMYAGLGMWEKVADVREMVGAMGMTKEVAWSSVAVRGEAHVFLVSDTKHEDSERIYETVEVLSCHY